MIKAKNALAAAGMLLSLTALSTQAAQTKTNANTSVTGSITIGSDCKLTAKLRGTNVTLTADQKSSYRGGAILDTLTVTPSCGSKVWVQGKDRNTLGQLLAKGEHNNITLGLGANSTAWDWRNDLQLLVTKKPLSAGMSETLNIALLGSGLPPYDEVQGNRYTYTLNAGYWID
ncbi:hypothetical protein ACVSDK_004768 [Escherichia coli]